MRSTTKLLIAVACSLAVVACKPESQKDGKVLAEVNGKSITEKEFNAEVENIPPQYRPMVMTPQGKKELLDKMIVQELAFEQAKKEGVDKSPEVADRLENLKKQLIIQTYVKKKLDEQKVQITDEEARKFYDQNQDKFKTDAGIRPFDQVKDQIKGYLQMTKQQKVLQDLSDSLKKGAKYSVKEDALGQPAGKPATPPASTPPAAAPPAGTPPAATPPAQSK